jgi:hypothetical protein
MEGGLLGGGPTAGEVPDEVEKPRDPLATLPGLGRSNWAVSTPTGIRSVFSGRPGTWGKTSRSRPSTSPFSANTRAASASALEAASIIRGSFLTTYSMALPCGSMA